MDRSSIRPRGFAAQVLLAATIAAGSAALLFGLAGDAFRTHPGGAWLAGVAWVTWGVVVAGVLTSVGHRFPWAWVAAGAVWGLTAASTIAEHVEQRLPGAIRNGPASASFGAPLDEEAVKTLGVFLILIAVGRVLDPSRAGMAIGAAVGLGFAMLEGWAFSMDGIVHDHHDWHDIADELWARGILDLPASHLVFTAVAGTGVGILLDRHRSHRVLVATGLFAVAVGSHSLHNALSGRPTAQGAAGLLTGAVSSTALISVNGQR